MRRQALAAIFLLASCSNQAPAPAPAPVAAGHRPAAIPTPKPKPRPTQDLEIVPPDVALEPTATPELNLVPDNKNLLEEVAFKSPSEVEELLGAPDEKLEREGNASWYYLREEPGTKGKRVCPEVQFLANKARFVIFWTPEAMRARIAEAREAGANSAPGRGADFTFKDAFKHLGVGASTDALLTDLGEPDARRKVSGGAEEWDYDTLIVEYGSTRRMTVKVKDGKVLEVRSR